MTKFWPTMAGYKTAGQDQSQVGSFSFLAHHQLSLRHMHALEACIYLKVLAYLSLFCPTGVLTM